MIKKVVDKIGGAVFGAIMALVTGIGYHQVVLRTFKNRLFYELIEQNDLCTPFWSDKANVQSLDRMYFELDDDNGHQPNILYNGMYNQQYAQNSRASSQHGANFHPLPAEQGLRCHLIQPVLVNLN